VKKSSSKTGRIVSYPRRGSRPALKRDAQVLSEQLQIPLIAALEMARVLAAKSRAQSRRDDLKAVLKILSTSSRNGRIKRQRRTSHVVGSAEHECRIHATARRTNKESI